MVDEQHNALVLDGADPYEIARLVPSSRRVNGYTVLRASLANLQVLARAGVAVPSPMMNYDWPSRPGLTPMQVQKQTAAFLTLNKRAFVLSEMRTGKTLSALWAADFIMQHEPGTKCLIVANLSTLRRTWAKEIFDNFMGRRTYAVCHASNSGRIRELERDVDFFIVNHDGVGVGAAVGTRGGINYRGFAAALRARADIRVAIIDEASAYREASTKRHRIARELLGCRDYLWQMTGTPTPNAPTDAYGLAKLANNAYGESYRSFQARTMVQVSPFKWVPRSDSHAVVQATLSPAIRFTQEDCFDAPPLMVEDRDAELSTEQEKLLRELKREATVLLASSARIDVMNEGVLRTKLIQIACGAVYDGEHFSHAVDARPRLALLKEVIAEAPKKVIVFAPLTNAIDTIKSELDKGGLSCEVVDGRVGASARDSILRSFQTTSVPHVLIAHPGPIARGLDLTASATIVWYAPTDKTEDYLQANERINGPAQKTARSVVRIAATPVEREIYKRLESNQSVQGAMLKLIEEG